MEGQDTTDISVLSSLNLFIRFKSRCLVVGDLSGRGLNLRLDTLLFFNIVSNKSPRWSGRLFLDKLLAKPPLDEIDEDFDVDGFFVITRKRITKQ